jgi:hypothetical protein
MTNQPLNGAWEQASLELAELLPLKELATELKVYPVRLLAQLVEQSDRRQGPVPDHTLTLLPYLGETALRALVDGGYISKVDDVSYAIAAYEPTDKGRSLASGLKG